MSGRRAPREAIEAGLEELCAILRHRNPGFDFRRTAAPVSEKEFSLGTEIRFRNADGELVGIVNAEPFYLDEDIGPYIPVYVPATDTCMSVHSLNIVASEGN